MLTVNPDRAGPRRWRWRTPSTLGTSPATRASPPARARTLPGQSRVDDRRGFGHWLAELSTLAAEVPPRRGGQTRRRRPMVTVVGSMEIDA